MTFANLKIVDRDGVRWITVNRPEKLNALNIATIAELDRAIAAIEDDASIDAVVVTGAGDKAFVAGADISELTALDPVAAKEFALRGQAVFRRLEKLDRPVVAAINGFALGGGCELAMACHLRVASTKAVLGQPEVKLGLIPGYGGTQRLPRLVGRGRALELLLSGRNVPADEACRIGLVNVVCEPDDLEASVDRLLASIRGNGPLALGLCLEAVGSGLDMGLDDGCLLEATLFGVGAASDQMKEGTAAFLERRKPQFRKP
ncbi:MAG: enoyl-CoA hydratase-related protein [Thermoanaerobaculales bacterium]|jgi:enoyl-CoA hydratase|nr:enoyl-CoA hydratase-related protein [Thermoanaerobaculales bacterium]